MNEKLKPCPLCNEQVKVETNHYPYEPKESSLSILGYEIQCNCGLKYLKYCFGRNTTEKLKELIENWNSLKNEKD
jgi:hypothetical protein